MEGDVWKRIRSFIDVIMSISLAPSSSRLSNPGGGCPGVSYSSHYAWLLFPWPACTQQHIYTHARLLSESSMELVGP